MVDEGKLSSVLSEFARTLATDFPIQGILDHLVQRIVEVLPITAAGVTLIDGAREPRYVAASDPSALRFERLQTDLMEGPCIAAYNSGEAVAVVDLRSDGRFPKFAPAGVAAGMAAVFTFPLHESDGCLGALDLYRDVPGALDSDDMAAAQTLADVTAAYLLNAQAREAARATAAQFRYNALHDPLTGLPNRLLLAERLEHAAERARRSRSHAAVLFADLDQFKRINDTHGHAVGDELLRLVADRLSGLVRPGDTLARLYGDEFVVLCEDLHNADEVQILARRIDAAFAEPFRLEGGELAVRASVGIAFAGPGEDITDELIATADRAMYEAKRSGGATHHIIDLREIAHPDDLEGIEGELRRAYGDGALDVAYQPIVRSADGLVTGAEALLRWWHPHRGPVSPLSMITVAEQSGLIHDIGAWILERSCRDRSRWVDEYPDAPLDVAVNVSGRQLISPDFAATVAALLAATAMDPTALILEITESVLIEDSERVMTALVGLKALGVRIALDDFGTGYSSLSYLRRLPIDIVKIDQSFITDIGGASTGGAIVAAVTNLAHVLGLTVTAEGVETQRQCVEIRTIGCESAQGYYYARPMPAAAIAEQLRTAPSLRPHLPCSV